MKRKPTRRTKKLAALPDQSSDLIGSGALLQPRSSADTEGEVQRVLRKLEAAGVDLLATRLVANSSNSFRPFILLSDALLNRAALEPTIREVVILHLAARRETKYEWFEHSKIASAAGVTQDQLAAVIACDYDSGIFTKDQLFAISIADRLIAGGGLTRRQWTEALERWGTPAVLDLIFTIGWWGGFIPIVLEAIGDEALGVAGYTPGPEPAASPRESSP
jgi:alkylhydroperoxidase family enzyme